MMNRYSTLKTLLTAVVAVLLLPTNSSVLGDDGPNWGGLVAEAKADNPAKETRPSSRRSSRRKAADRRTDQSSKPAVKVDLAQPDTKPAKERPIASSDKAGDAGKPSPPKVSTPSESSLATPSGPSQPSLSELKTPPDELPATSMQRTTDRVLFSSITPAIDIKVLGSESVEVGKSTHFEVVVANTGNHPAKGLFVRVRIPESVNIHFVSATDGEVTQPGIKEANHQIIWKFDELGGQSKQRMDLELVSSSRNNFQLQTEWTILPVNQGVEIAAQQPELALAITAPETATYGEKAECSLTVRNSGNGTAHNVVLEVALNGIAAKRYELARLDEGEEETYSVALAELPAGDVKLAVTATADSDLRTEAVQRIVVNRPDLRVVIDGPRARTAGTRANYKVKVSNSGTLSAVNLRGEMKLTGGLEILRLPEGLRRDKESIAWSFEELLPGEEKTFLIQCLLPSPGTQSIDARVLDGHGNRAESTATTLVEAKANVHLIVESSQTTLAVGDETTYELYLENSGSRAADQVSVVAQLPKHLEVVDTEGLETTIENEMIRFQTIPRLAAGDSKLLSIRTKAVAEGTDPIYVELATLDPDKRIAYESKTDVR